MKTKLNIHQPTCTRARNSHRSRNLSELHPNSRSWLTPGRHGGIQGRPFAVYLAALLFIALSLSFASVASATPISSNGTGGGIWSAPATWAGGVVPGAADDVTIANGDTVTIDTAALCNNLTVGQGVAGVLQYQDTATARSLTASGSVTISAGGAFTAFPVATATGAHTLSLAGNLSNSGTINFNIVTGGFTSSVQITFTGAGLATWTGNGNTNLKQTTGVSLNKGTNNSNTLEFTPGTGSFTVLGGNAAGFLSITNGTFKISGTNAFSNPVFNTVAYSIPATGGIWLNNGSATIVGQNGNPTMSGLLRMTSGVYNVGTVANNAMGGATTSNFIIEGGIMNFASRLLVTSASAQFNMSAGTLNMNTVGNTASASPSFGFTGASIFTMSGGIINLVQATTTGATLQDYQVSSTAFITGGTVNVGTAATATNFIFRIQGQMPNVVIDNTTNNKTANLSAQTNVWGNLTINPGTTINLNPIGTAQTLLMIGSTITNNGAIITGTTNTGTVNFAGGLQLTASGGSGTAQTYTGTGTFGTAVTTIATLSLQNGAGVTLDPGVSNLNVQRVNMFFGSITNSNKIALGNGGATQEIIQRGVGGNPLGAGGFDVAPTFNIGTGGLIIVYAQSATGVYSTGVEIPGSRNIFSIQILNPGGINLTGGALTTTSTTTGLVLAGGTLNTSAANLLTLAATTAGAVSGGNANTYVNGPLARTLPASLISGSTYTFPVGKGSFKMLELVNPTTNAGGTVIVQVEAFDADSGGAGGTGFSDIMHNRYWSAAITAGAANFTNTTVRLTEVGTPAANAIGQSATQGGAYNTIGGTVTPPTIGPSSATTSLGFFAVGNLTGAPTLTGSFNVGTGQTYGTLTAAVTAYNNSIQTGPVTFLLTDSSYTTDPLATGEVFPIVINPNPGASATNTVTIKPAPGITPAFTGTSATALITLNGADYVTIDGSNTVGGSTRDMSLTNTNTSTSSAVIWGQTVGTNDPATNNTVKNLNITGNATTTTFGGIGFGSSTISTATIGNRNDNNRIQNNNIVSVQFGIVSQGNSSANKNFGTVITGNTLGGAGALALGRAGIYVGFEDGVQITNNNVVNVGASNSSDVFGIALGSIAISTTAFSTNNDVANAAVTGNTIGSVIKTDTFSCAGISVGTPLYGTNRVANNMIAGVNGNGTSGDFAAGIYVGGSQNATTQLYYNSVSMTGSRDTGGAPTSPSYALCVLGQNPLIDVRDNILFNTQTSATVASTSYAIGLSSLAPFSNITSNYNDLFTSGANAAFSRIGSLVQGPVLAPATDLTSLATWQSTVGKDANSVSGNPQFTSTTNLHINPSVGTLVESGGTSVGGICADIDNDTRQGCVGYGGTGTAPDIGADEGNFTQVVTNDVSGTAFITPTNGGGVVAGSTFSPQASFSNNGTATQTNVTVRYRICTDGTCTTELYNNTQVIASIASGVTTTVTFVSTSVSAGTYTMKARSELAGDQVPANDEITGSFTAEAPLNGSYTVGTGGNYSSLTQAVSKLNSLGVSGPVTLNLIENGTRPDSAETYPITINAVPGTSATNTVTIKPATGQNISFTAPLAAAAASVLKLNGASWIIIDGSNNGTSSRNLTLTNNNTASNTAAVWVASNGTGLGSTNDTVKNCNLAPGSNAVSNYGVFIGGTSIVAGGTGADNDNITIQNNNITLAATGIYAFGTASVSAGGDNNLSITGNSIDYNNTSSGVASIGIEVGNALNSSVSQNTVSEQTSSSQAPTAISLETGFVSSSVTRNTVTNSVTTNTGGYGGRGITVGTGTATSALTIANNVIYGVNGTNWSSFSNSSAMGIAIGTIGNSSTLTTTAGGINLYYNSVNMFGTYSSTTACLTTALYVGTGASALDLRDNVFVNSLLNTGTGSPSKAYAIYDAGTSGVFTTINYNDYFVSGAQGVLGFLSADQTTLAAWRTATGQDLQSQSADPLFNSSTNLQPQLGSPVLAAGTPVSVTIDFTGVSRSGTNPSEGAYENGVDSASPTISYAPLGNTVSTANRTLISTIADATGVPTSGIGLPVLYYKKNSGPYFSAQATYGGGSSYSFLIDYSVFGGVTQGDTISYFVVAQDTFSPPNVGSNPSAGAGNFTANPPAAGIPPTTPNSYSILNALSGTYTVGSGGNYPSLTGTNGAITGTNGLNNSVLNGPVTFLLIDAIYNMPEATESYPITINANGGSSATNTVTIKPAAGNTVTITASSGAAASAVFILNGTSYVTIDGSNNGTSSRDLTITNNNTSTSSAVVWLQTSPGAVAATNNVIKNVNLVGSGNTQTLIGVGSGGTTISITSLGTGNNNNTFQNNNISKTQYGIYSQGASAANKNTGNVITQNLINAASPNNVQLGAILVGFENNIQITRNSISNVSTSGSNDAIGIALGLTAISTTGFTGNDVTNAVVTQNNISGVASLSTTGFSAVGITVASTTTGTNLIANNYISGITSPATSPDFTAGIFAGGGTGSTTQIYANSVSLTGARGSGTTFPSYGIAIGGSNPTVDARDNIFFNTQTGGTGKSYAIGLAYSTYTNLTSDYNDLFVSGASSFVGQTGGLGTTGTDRSNLAAWQAQTGTDAHSISADPQFVSTTDLHLNTSPIPPVSRAGVTIAGITTDFDGDTRQSPPDIGADEITTYVLTYTAGANGSIMGSTPQEVISGGSGTAVTAVPNACYHFVNWSDGSTQNPRTDTNVLADLSVTANFAINTYTLTYTAGPNGSITGSTPQTVNCGGSGTAVTAVPNACYHFVNWSDGSTQNPRTDTNVMMDINVTANFAINTYTLTYTAGPNGSISGASPQMVNCGSNGAAVTAIPDACYHFVNWSDGSTQNPRTDTNVQMDINVTANFAINTYTLTYTAGPHGSISGTSPQTVNCGSDGTAVTAVPDSGYAFHNWSDNSTANPRTDTNVTADISVTANFVSTNANLANLVLSQGTLQPAFDPNILNYTADERHRTTSITVTPTVQDANATITVNGQPVPSGQQSQPISLSVGNNTITVEVFAQDEMHPNAPMTTKTYTIIANRADVPVVTNTNDSGAGSLRDALDDVFDGETITFSIAAQTPNVAQVITLSSGELVVNNSVTIAGSGANMLTVMRDPNATAFRIYHIVPGKTVTISGMTISGGNSGAGNGGGILNDHSVLTVNSCAISGNINSGGVPGYGGGIYNDGSSSASATLTVIDSTLSGNSSNAGSGGGIYNEGSGGMANLTITNSTLSGNSSSPGTGGAIVNRGISGGVASLRIVNSTLSGNFAGNAGGIWNESASLTLGNTILKAGATGTNIAHSGGTAASVGFNLSSDAADGVLTATGDQINTDPMLEPLKDNGGPTLTHAPLIGSPAIDQGKRDTIPALTTNVDQRGFVRPVNDPAVANAAGGDASDIGAVELQQFVHPNSSVSRKTHTGVGDFDVDLPMLNFANSPLGIECRTGGAAGVYKLIFFFSEPVSFSSASVTSGSGSVSSVSGSGTNQLTINLTGVTDVQTITVGLFDVTDGANSADVGTRMGVLLGDVNGNRSVNAADVSLTKSNSGSGVSQANFRSDVNVNGAISAADVSLVKSKSGNGLP